MKRNAFSVVLPYYNELDYLRPTLESCLAQQRLPDQLILVDNASTDGSEQLCREILRDPRVMDVVYLRESKPGFLQALMCGLAAVECEYAAVWNADTYYPPQYFALCERLFRDESPSTVALMAKDIYAPPDSLASRTVRYSYHALARWRSKMAFTGSFGQILRTDALRACGGYSADYWPYTMEDHELIHRLCKLGPTRTHPDLWCMPSTRRQDRSGIRWTLAERLLYFATPHAYGDWYFYRFLAPRFARRKMIQLNLRAKDWATTQALPSERQSPPPPHQPAASHASLGAGGSGSARRG
jgi:glycosyltransferase involved in cell wall biosynthesis